MSEKKFPEEFGRYQLTGLLGAGGMAEVYRAETAPVAGITREVAIKRMHQNIEADVDLRNMLLDEARIWVRLKHPNIITVLEVGEADGVFFLALELVEGVTVSEIIRASGPLPVREALAIAERVARALAYAHTLTDKGRPLQIVHRDVKPANVMISCNGEIKLTDFGIARAADRITRTAVGLIKGSLPYLAPEQIRGEEMDGRTDLFSLGCTLHTMLTGRQLIEKTREALMIALDRGDIPPPPENLPRPVQDLLRALTSPLPGDRPADALEVARRIRGILQPESPEDLEPALGAKAAATLQGAQALKAIKAMQKAQSKSGMKAPAVARAVPVASPPPGESDPAATEVRPASPAPREAPTSHPSWREPDLSALPPDDGLDAVRAKPAAAPEPAPAEAQPAAPAPVAAPPRRPPPRTQHPAPMRPSENTAQPSRVIIDSTDAFEIAPQLGENEGPLPGRTRKPPASGSKAGVWRVVMMGVLVLLLGMAAISLPGFLHKPNATPSSMPTALPH